MSVALAYKGEPIVAAIYNPITDSLFSAEKGKGVFWNGRSVRVSENPANLAMITFGMSSKPEDQKEMKRMFAGSKTYVRRVRHLGSIALELAYLARGGTEGCINLGTKIWDYAAGQLLVREAGGMITDLSGNPCDYDEPYFIASNGIVHPALVELVREGGTIL